MTKEQEEAIFMAVEEMRVILIQMLAELQTIRSIAQTERSQ